MSAFGDKVSWAWFSDAVAALTVLLQRRHVFACWKKNLGCIVAQSVQIVEPVLDLLLFIESVTVTGKLSLGIVILQAGGGHGWFQQRRVGQKHAVGGQLESFLARNRHEKGAQKTCGDCCC